MLANPMDVLAVFPVRKSKAQKQAFRDAVQSYVKSLGYSAVVEKGSFGSRNLVIGNPEEAKFLITAHYDTPARMFLPNLITPCNFLVFLLYQFVIVGLFVAVAMLVGITSYAVFRNFDIAYNLGMFVYFLMLILMMAGPANKHNANDNTSGVVSVLEIARTLPENMRHKVAFVLFDLEELGLIGSASYRKTHKAATENQIVLNLDCVGDGDEIVFFPTKKLCKDKSKMLHLCKCVGRFNKKTIAVRNKGFRFYPSDQANFPYGVGIAAFRRKKGVGLYCNRIHTNRDTILEETNVNILRAALTTYVSSDAAE